MVARIFPTTMATMACHQDSPKAINELPVIYPEMLELMRTPAQNTPVSESCTRKHGGVSPDNNC